MHAIARRAPSSQEGARQSRGHQRARRTSIWWESLERQEGRWMVKKATSDLQRPPGRFRFTLWEPTGNLELSAPNSILCRNPQRYALIFPHWFSLSGHRLGPPHTSTFFLRCVTLGDDASRYIVYFCGTSNFKTVRSLSDMVLA